MLPVKRILRDKGAFLTTAPAALPTHLAQTHSAAEANREAGARSTCVRPSRTNAAISARDEAAA